MIYLYTYLSGIAVVLLLHIFVKWLRPKNRFDIQFLILSCLFSWITIITIVVIVYKGWKEERDIIRNLPNKE
jgi:predicted PurR-regulated permease PerM